MARSRGATLGRRALGQINQLIGKPPDVPTENNLRRPYGSGRVAKLTAALSQGGTATFRFYSWKNNAWTITNEKEQTGRDLFMKSGATDIASGTYVFVFWVGTWLILQAKCT